MKIIQEITIIVLLVIFFLGRFFWSYIEGKRKKANVSVTTVRGRFWLSIIFVALMPILIVINPGNIFEPLKITHNVSVVYLVGLLISLVGIVFMILARLHRHNDWGFMGDSAGQVLFTQGIYSITRHPYYIGAILVIWGMYLIANSWLIFVTFLGVMFIVKVIHEEDNFLHYKFGEEWIEYKKQVGIIPYIRRF
jgi:protein-S-isoprenylcysteine O-methyltransferase Ste14